LDNVASDRKDTTMANTAPPKNEPNIEFDALAEKVVPEPNKPVDVVALRGYVGRSAQEGHVRLYRTLHFDDYVEISVSAIIHIQQLSTPQSPLRGSLVYVKSESRLQRVQVSAQTEAQFLDGAMMSAARSAARVSSFGGASRALYVHRAPHSILCASNAPTSCADMCPDRRGGDGGGPGLSDDDNCFIVHGI
jgi:hypothetical protein